MTTTTKMFAAIAFATFVSISFPIAGHSQDGIKGWFKKQKEKIFGKADSLASSKVDALLNGKPNANGTSKKQGKLKHSEIDEAEFTKVVSKPLLDPNNTRVKLAGNLLVDIKGKYPMGYQPKWRFFTYNAPLTFDAGNYVVPYPLSNTDTRNIAIGDYKGKAVLKWDAGYECFADIIINDSFTVLTSTPQIFKVTSFERTMANRKSGEKCRAGNNPYIDGGFEGKIILSANEDGDIKMTLWVENYSVGSERDPSFVSYTYFAENLNVANEMSAADAISIVKAEQEAKQKQKDYIAKTTKQADSLQKVIVKKYPQKDCRECFSRGSNFSIKETPTTNVYTNGYGDVVGTQSSFDWDVNTKTAIKNKCNYNLLFIGIQQLHDDEKGYYLKEVTKIMEAGYSYSSDQGIMSSLFTSLIGGGSEYNFTVQEKYNVNYASVGATQWIRVIKK